MYIYLSSLFRKFESFGIFFCLLHSLADKQVICMQKPVSCLCLLAVSFHNFSINERESNPNETDIQDITIILPSYCIYTHHRQSYAENICISHVKSFYILISNTDKNKTSSFFVQGTLCEGCGHAIFFGVEQNIINVIFCFSFRLDSLISMLRSTGETNGMPLDRTPSGPTSMMQSGISQAREFDDPPGLHEKTEYLLRE